MMTPLLKKSQLTVGLTVLLLVNLATGCAKVQSKDKQSSYLSEQDNSTSAQAQINTISNQTPTNPQQNSPAQPQQQSVSDEYQVIDEQQNFKYTVRGSQVFSTGKIPTVKVDFNAEDLLTVLINTRKYFQDHAANDPVTQRTGLLGTQGVTVQDTLQTLDFAIAVTQEDIAKKQPSRLQDPNFINQNFKVIKWSPYNPRNPKQKRLRMTKYAVFTYPGSRKKTATYNTGIYSLKDNATADKFYTKYTKQDVLSGIYEPGGREFGKVEPLAYLTREGLEEALLQGTVYINFPDGTKGVFNVDRSNEIPFVKGVSPRQQKRYWYFREVDSIKGYGYKIDAKISIEPGVTFAGDVLNIGLGRIVVLEYPQGGNKRLKLGIIADTGGAFLPNLYQLDYLSGVFPNKKAFEQYIRQLPEFVTTYILLKK